MNYGEERNQLQKKYNNNNQKKWRRISSEKSYQTGDLVLIKETNLSSKSRKISSKLLLPYRGPFKINRSISQYIYELVGETDTKVRGIYHVSRLKPYFI